MNFINLPFLLLCISTILIILLLKYILSQKPLTQLKKAFSLMILCVFIICFGVLLEQSLCNIYNINPICFEYFIYIGTCFLPIFMFFTAIIFKNTKVKFTKKYLVLFIIPIISLLVLWSNNWHHCFYINYSINIKETIFGPYFIVHSTYTYGLVFISMFILLQNSFKTSGFFSRQTLLLLLGTLIPIIINILGTSKLVNMNVYLTPISFSVAMLLYGLAILKYKFLNISPIALQRIVNVMSDSYIVLDSDENIVDYNQTLVNTFKLKNKSIRKLNIFDLFGTSDNIDNFKKAYYSSIHSKKTCTLDFHDTSNNKYFNIEISPLFNKKIFIGVLILFKDITQHMKDMQTIKNNQDTLMERERLASLGQLIGGIAHNLKTPIMSISGAAEGLTDLIKEYQLSVGDPEVTLEDHKEIAKDMNAWIAKIKTHTEYMSDVITAVKGQAVTLSNETEITFTVEELLKRVNILMKHELKNAIIYLNISIQTDEKTSIRGDINSLVQVINNMISNAIQSYNGKTNEKIDLIVSKENNNLIISVKDYGVGIPKKVKDKLFKEMITTKGKNGTGLGLYMSYSTIKAHFNGNITIDSEEGKGSTFNVIIPL